MLSQNAETSNAAIKNIATSLNDISNPSSEEFVAISNENCRLKNLLETGMLKSLKGHQTLCVVLKKSILHRNPRKEGLGFKRKLNVDGTYWTPEQYPRTSWVLAKSKTLKPALLSGYDTPIPVVSDESDDSNYKVFKQQNGKVFARYVGTNCRSSSPKKQIWVKKCIIENLSVTANLNPQGNSRQGNENPSQYGTATSSNACQLNLRQKEYMRISSNHYAHVSGNNFNAYSYDYSRDTQVIYGNQRRNVPAQTRQMRSAPPTQVWVARKN